MNLDPYLALYQKMELTQREQKEKVNCILTYLLTYILAIQVVEFSNGGFKIGKVSTKESTYSKEIIEF